MVADLSYDVQTKDIADLAPHFRDGEIEEVMVISPKHRPIHSSGQGVKAGDFRLLYTLFKDSISSTHLCRKCDDFQLYAMRILNKERVRIRSPRDHIQLQMEICQEIRELRSSFLSPFIWIYEDGPEIHSIAEFYPNGSLQDLLDRDTSLGESHVLHIACEIVEALHMLHTAGIIHRDLAPCNIMFDVSGHVVISGFGQACRPDSATSFPLPDTGLYCAPELILGWAHDFSVDCWSFGLLMYIMLFGSHPYVADNDNDNAAILQTKVLHCSLMVPQTASVSWTAQDLLVKCLERNAALRLDIKQIKAHTYFCTVWV
ncbi:kinase-like domain-containing protein [Suillus subalutaceus]|uniref:kinase-like domain-containing protein n=1 Tax=Suillus subalutaceus TaxID=48586 RepID=UPI001B87D122|nr:kinase-like domain-containing protein [Suillus subalutaceus]KAG1839651.1 kinase-like domain-containing protein [Suillus subalutaceus]